MKIQVSECFILRPHRGKGTVAWYLPFVHVWTTSLEKWVLHTIIYKPQHHFCLLKLQSFVAPVSLNIYGGVVTRASQSFCGKDAAEFLHLWHTYHKKPSSRDITTRRNLLRQATEYFCSLICKVRPSQMTLVSTDDMYPKYFLTTFMHSLMSIRQVAWAVLTH